MTKKTVREVKGTKELQDYQKRINKMPIVSPYLSLITFLSEVPHTILY